MDQGLGISEDHIRHLNQFHVAKDNLPFRGTVLNNSQQWEAIWLHGIQKFLQWVRNQISIHLC
jgi:hypothetical protein